MAYDVIVVGGGNTHFSGAVLRFKYDDLSKLHRFVLHTERDYPDFHKGLYA